jgi:hypothetical protein
MSTRIQHALFICASLLFNTVTNAALLASGPLGEQLVNTKAIEDSGYFFAITDRPITSYLYVFEGNVIVNRTRVHSLTAADGSLFAETTGLLTNGRLDYLHTEELSSGWFTNVPETSFIFHDNPERSGIDFSGATIEEVRLITAVTRSNDFSGYLAVDHTLEIYGSYHSAQPAALVPVPPAFWLFGSGMLGLVGFATRRNPPSAG